MIYKLTTQELQIHQKAIKECEEMRRKASAISDTHDLVLMDKQISLMKRKFQRSYSESTPLWEVQSMIEKEFASIHEKALGIQREFCRIYKKSETISECESCPFYSDKGDEDKCFYELKKNLVYQYLNTEFYV